MSTPTEAEAVEFYLNYARNPDPIFVVAPDSKTALAYVAIVNAGEGFTELVQAALDTLNGQPSKSEAV
jgi:hypothetical protein